MGEELQALRSIIDEKTLSILETLANEDGELYLRELAVKAKVPPATTHRIIQKLLDLKIIEKTEIKNLKIYKLSTTKQADFLKKILYSKVNPLDMFLTKLKQVSGVDLAVLHAKAQKSSAFVLVVGDELPIIKINDLSEAIEKEHGFKIKILPLQHDQYDMLAAGHTGYKKVLYRKE
ncbi:hypothetical protein C0585_08405 [Candidatus Woesearchaeota archaeon]|nr:MAG: hypothetical protein C0585_08405 [Candidatus Woesearchaeota archaeon]